MAEEDVTGAHELIRTELHAQPSSMVRLQTVHNLPVARVRVHAARITEAQVALDAVVRLLWDDGHGNNLVILRAHKPVMAVVTDGLGHPEFVTVVRGHI